MEKRVVVLVILCVVVFVGWSLLMKAIYPPRPLPPPPPPAQGTPQQTPVKLPDPATPPSKVEARQGDEPERLTPLANERVRLILTNKGAGIREGTVLVPDQAPMPLLKPFDPTIPHLALTAEGSGDDTARAAWSVKAEEPGRSITYVFKLRNGVDIEKQLILKPDGNEVEMLLTLSKIESASPVALRLKMIPLTGLTHDSPYRYDYYGHGFVTTNSGGAHSTTTVTYDAPETRPRFDRDPEPPKYYTVEVPREEQASRYVEWLGLRNRYAAAILVSKDVPSLIRRVDFRATTQPANGGPALKALAVEVDLGETTVAAAPHRAKFSLYLAPIRREDLAEIKGGEEFLLSYGCWGLFNPIGRLILWLLGVAHKIAGNYGWAIILTTFFIRLCLFPLTKKSQVSMARMANLQPKLTVLRERFADDPSKQQQETMKLFKEHGVNPLSGCFPILMQLPIFIGLYSVLDISIDFRHAPFIAWIKDLSQPDKLIAFQHPINLGITSISEFNLVPIVMTVTWFLQSYYAPRPQDPKLASQQKMMMFMPIVFGLLCYSLASGLSLYLFVNSLLAMIEQKIIKKYFLPAQAAVVGPPAKV